MKIAVCYYSCHHGNTLKVLQAMAQISPIDLFDISARQTVQLEGYDLVGFASGIYGFGMHESVADYIRRYLPQGKPIFFVYTYGGAKGSGAKAARQAAQAKGAPVWGEYGCKGYNTFGPFKMLGGIAKGHPNAAELQKAQNFLASLLKK